MSKFTTFVNNMAKPSFDKKDLDAVCDLLALVVKDDLGKDSPWLITSWAEENDIYLDFYFALRPVWLVDTPDDKQLKMSVTIDTDANSWYVHIVMDCEDGECESWGEKEFKPEELEGSSMPVKYMVETMRQQYNARLEKENARTDDDIKVAVKAKTKMMPHVEAIKKIAEKAGVKLYIDRNLDGSNCAYVVSDNLTIEESDDDEVELDKIPCIDLGACGFDSNYDHFTRK